MLIECIYTQRTFEVFQIDFLLRRGGSVPLFGDAWNAHTFLHISQDPKSFLESQFLPSPLTVCSMHAIYTIFMQFCPSRDRICATFGWFFGRSVSCVLVQIWVKILNHSHFGCEVLTSKFRKVFLFDQSD